MLNDPAVRGSGGTDCELRVLLVIDRLWEVGGSEASTSIILSGLAGQGIHFDVVALDGIDIRDRSRLEAIGTQFFEPLGAGVLAQLQCVIRAIRGRKPDLVHATLARAELVARLAGVVAGVPVITSIVSMPYSPEAVSVAPSEWKLEAYRRLDGLLARHATFAFHSVSVPAADAAHDALGIRRDRITVVNRGRDRDALGEPDAPRRARVRSELGLGEKQTLVLNVGRQDVLKGQLYLLGALEQISKQHPDAVLAIAGREGSATDSLRHAIRDHRMTDNVRLLGVRSDVPDLLCAADVFAFASLFEGLPGALLEALALSVPIVAFDIPAVREVVGDTAILVPSGDTDALAAGINELIEQPDRNAALARAGRERFELLFTKERYLEAMRRLYLTTWERAQSEYRGFPWLPTRRQR